ncbi:MAG: hypothetical protein R2824_33390 [Saprospiraceae bacterium]
MIRSVAMTRGRSGMSGGGLLLLLLVCLVLFYYFYQSTVLVHSTATLESGLSFDYREITSELSVDWSGGGDFDPRDKCPKDFFGDGFILICKKMSDGQFFKFLYHQKKQLLYRIDQDIIQGTAKIGLHWVESTFFNAKYRIADPSFKGGKTLSVPNARGGVDQRSFQYGEAVSKKRVQYRRELFRQTHIDAKPCQDWWDIFTFTP